MTMSSFGDGIATDRGTFAELQRRIRDAGLLRPAPAYYTYKILTNLLLYAAGWTAFFLIGDSWWQLATAAVVAFAFGQTGAIGHDAGHLQIARGRRGARLLGYLHGNLLLGFSYGWRGGHHP